MDDAGNLGFGILIALFTLGTFGAALILQTIIDRGANGQKWWPPRVPQWLPSHDEGDLPSNHRDIELTDVRNGK
jgi:hypothetical protein